MSLLLLKPGGRDGPYVSSSSLSLACLKPGGNGGPRTSSFGLFEFECFPPSRCLRAGRREVRGEDINVVLTTLLNILKLCSL